MADIILQDLKDKKVIVIRSCLECPYASIECSEVYCTGKDKKHHQYLGLTQQMATERIPDWCHLPTQAFVKDA